MVHLFMEFEKGGFLIQDYDLGVTEDETSLFAKNPGGIDKLDGWGVEETKKLGSHRKKNIAVTCGKLTPLLTPCIQVPFKLKMGGTGEKKLRPIKKIFTETPTKEGKLLQGEW